MKISAAIREYLIEIEVRKYTPKHYRKGEEDGDAGGTLFSVFFR